MNPIKQGYERSLKETPISSIVIIIVITVNIS